MEVAIPNQSSPDEGYPIDLLGDEHELAEQSVREREHLEWIERGLGAEAIGLPAGSEATQATANDTDSHQEKSVVKAYMSRIAGVRINLTEETERSLATQVQAGLHAQKELRDAGNKAMSNAAIEELERVRANGTEAEGQLIESNLPWVVTIAKRYLNRGLAFEDLIQEGNIGLIIAVRKLDPDKGRLTTLVYWWVRQSITLALARKGSSICLPIEKKQAVRRLEFIRTRLEIELGRTPRDVEVADELGVDVDRIKQLDKLNYEFFYPSSLDAPLRNSTHRQELTLGETVAHPQTENQESEAKARSLVWAMINNAGLEPAAKTAIILRFGLDGGGIRSYEEIADLRDPAIQALQVGKRRKVGSGRNRQYPTVSRERVRLLVAEATGQILRVAAHEGRIQGDVKQALQRLAKLRQQPNSSNGHY